MQALYDTSGAFCVNTAYIIPVDDKYLLGILNSNPVLFYYANITSSIRGGYLRFINQYLIQIPIPIVSESEKRGITTLVDKIISAKQSDPQADTSALEAEVDRLVYGLYGLTAAEIAIVEGAA